MYRFIKRLSALFLASMIASTAMTVFAEKSPTAEFSQFQKPVADNRETAVCTTVLEPEDKPVCENEYLGIYLNKTAGVMKLLSKETGYIWTTAGQNKEGMSPDWERFSSSLAVMDFITSGGSIKRSPSATDGGGTEFSLRNDGFDAVLTFPEAQATATMSVTLDGNILQVTIPDESIKISDGNTVGKIMLMPFLGASYKDEIPGYVFVPDGSGAIMNFSTGRQYNSLYRQRIYGDDVGVTKAAPLDTTTKRVPVGKISVPVFGSVHGIYQNAFAGIVTGGDAYCDINASPSGSIIDYTWIAPAFIYNELYWQSTGKTGGFNTVQKQQNLVNAQVEYHFLSKNQASYVGMAGEYRQLLAARNPGFTQNTPVEHIPLKVDALMAEPAKSLFGNKTLVMTTIEDANRWADELLSEVEGELKLTLYGFEKGGLNGHKLGDFAVESKVGSKRQLTDLSKKLESSGSRLYLQTDIVGGYSGQLPKSSMKFGMDGNIVTDYAKGLLFSNKAYSTVSAMEKSVNNFFKAGLPKNLAIQRLGSELTGDQKRGAERTRLESMEAARNLITQLGEETDGLMLGVPNSYALASAEISGAYDMPVNNSRFEFFSEAVPFLQIVFGGYVDCYSEYQNFTANTISDLLRLIDYNTYPAYILTEEYSSKLVDTNLNSFYSTRYNDWKPYVLANYKTVNEILSQVSGAYVINRTSDTDGVSVTDYSNGKSVAVNYNISTEKARGLEIAGQSAICFETKGTEGE